MDVAAQRQALEKKVSGWNKPAPTPTPFVPPRTVRGARGNDGNPVLKPTTDSGVNYPPMPNTTPPKSPSDPHNPPPLPDKDPEDDSDLDEADEDDGWEDQEEDEGMSDAQTYDEGGREDYNPPQSKKEAALEQQRKQDAERFGGKAASVVMENARSMPPNADIPPFPIEKIRELALEKGLNANVVVARANAAYHIWQVFATDVKERALRGEDVSPDDLAEMQRLGMEACKIPAELMGIPSDNLPQMYDELAAGKTPEQQRKEAEDKAEAMNNFAQSTVALAMEQFNDHQAVTGILTGATALHLAGYNDRSFRRKMAADHFYQIMHAFNLVEQNEDAQKQEGITEG